jgi:rhodanese-related sulfurtransferase
MQTSYPAELVADFFKAKAAAYISPMGTKALIDGGANDFVIVDVRLRGPQVTWRIPGATAIPTNEMGERYSELPKDKLVVLYCWDTWCSLATTAAVVLLEHGFRVKELYGGVAAWRALRLPEQLVDPEEHRATAA